MELRHLRYFVAVAEELHFRRAAERLHVAQPAVSEQVRKLEDELGVKLFNRTQRSVSLTPSGTAMLDEARRVLRQADIAQMAARNARDQAVMVLRVGYMADSLPGAVARGLQHLSSDSPRVETRLEAGTGVRLIEDVREERLDAAVVSLPAPVAGLNVVSLGTQRPVAALPVTHQNAVDSDLHLERLAPERLVMLPREANPPFHSAVQSLLRDSGLTPAIVELGEPSVEQALLAVASGAGVALLPEAASERYATPGVRFVPLAGAAPAFESAIVTRPDPANLATMSFLRAVARASRPSVRAERRPALALAA